MTSGVLNSALRWIFWGVLYLAVALTAFVVTLGSLAPYLPGPVRWTMLGVMFWGIALDIQVKARKDGSRQGPPDDGELHPVESRSS